MEKKISEHFAPFLEAKAELNKKIKQFGEQAVKAFFKEYFETHPEVYGVKWTQFVPFYNDGDACVFSLNSVYTFATKEAFEKADGSLYDDEGAEECYGVEPRTSLSEIEEMLESIFGEHAQVAVTRTSIETEEYTDHE